LFRNNSGFCDNLDAVRKLLIQPIRIYCQEAASLNEAASLWVEFYAIPVAFIIQPGLLLIIVLTGKPGMQKPQSIYNKPLFLALHQPPGIMDKTW
jgi:hypothetical protein